MKRFRLLGRSAIPLILVVGLLLPGGLAPPRADAATNPCKAGSDITLTDLLMLAGDWAGPLVGKYQTDPMLVSDSALECYGSRMLRFTAWVRDAGVVGWEYLFGLKPGWLRSATGLFVSVAAELPPGVTPLVALAVPPALGNLQATYVGHRVTVTGHFDDPAARACVANGEPGLTPTTADAVAICRSTFVVAAVSPTAAPETAMADTNEPPTWWSAWLALSAALGGVATLWYAGRRRRR